MLLYSLGQIVVMEMSVMRDVCHVVTEVSNTLSWRHCYVAMEMSAMLLWRCLPCCHGDICHVMEMSARHVHVVKYYVNFKIPFSG